MARGYPEAEITRAGFREKCSLCRMAARKREASLVESFLPVWPLSRGRNEALMYFALFVPGLFAIAYLAYLIHQVATIPL